MCVSFLCIHFYLHPERVKDGQFSNAFAYMCSYFLLKIFTRFDTFRADNTREKFNMNPGEKQAEIYTYEAPWLIYACNWSVRLRFFCLYMREALRASLFYSLFLSLFICEMEFQSGAALYSLRNGIQIISTMLCTLCRTRRSIRANVN